METKAAARLVYEALRQGQPFPTGLEGITTPEDGYRVQLEVLELLARSSEVPVGWKVGLTSKVTQEILGFNERIFGYLLNSRALPSGETHPFSSLTEPLLEPELCVTLGEPLTGPGVTAGQARAAMGSIAPAIEVVQVGRPKYGGLPLTLADNSAQTNFITGAPTSPLSPDVDLVQSKVEVTINGEVVDRADGDAIMEGPQGSVAWLANKLAEFGHRLKSGDRIMTGSFTKPYPINEGDRIEVRIEPFGTVSFTAA